MHFNGRRQREAILRREEAEGYHRFEDKSKRFINYVNLCIFPHTWETTYYQLRENSKISHQTWECLMGSIYAMLINKRNTTEHSLQLVSEIAIDFVDYIRHDNCNNPFRFLMSMQRYMPRYCLLKTLYSVGICWREVAYELMGAKSKPAYTNYHTLFTNKYVRTLVKGIAVFKQMRTSADDDYLVGTNDLHTLIKQHSQSTKCMEYSVLEAVVNLYLTSLPSWNTSIRARVCYYISFLLPLHQLREKQMLPSLENKTLGTKSNDN